MFNSDLGDKAADDFLNSQTKIGTFKTYKTQLKQYLEWTKRTGQELIEAKRNDKNYEVENSLFAYRKHLLSLGKAETYAVGSLMAIRSFYAYHRVPLMFRKSESRKLTEKKRKTTDYLFDREDFSRMALAGNLKERYVLLLGKSIGLRASDFAGLTLGQFRGLKLDSEPPVPLGEIVTQKESVKAYPFLDSDAVPIVKSWLETHKEAKDGDKMLEDTEDNLTVVLQNLAKKAGFEVDKKGMIHGRRIRFHCLRKFLIDHLSATASESQWKQIVGKQIAESAYVSQDHLRGIYARAMPSLLINGNGMKARKLIELENALLESQRKMTAVETTNEVLRKRIEQLENGSKTMSETIGNINERLTYYEKHGKKKPIITENR